MASSNDQRIQPHLMAMPTTLNHISIAVNKEQEEQDQTFGNYIPNHFNGKRSWSHTQSLAPGYRFCPLDGELIVHYLRKKVNNEALPHNGIRDVTLYQHNPEYLTALYPALGDKKWYFFTPRDRKYPNGFRPNRATGNGYWKATGADKPVDYKDKVVGLRKVLVFYEGKPKPGKGIKTNWIMHEFRVKGPPRIKENQHDMKLDDWVLCRIYKKENGKEGEVLKGKMGGVQAEHKSVPVPVSVPSLTATLLEGSVNDSNLVGESSKYDEYIQSPQHPKIAQSIDEFHPYRDIFAASDPQGPQPTLVSIAWPATAARAPSVHLDNKYFQEEFDDLDDFDTYGLFAQNPNSTGQNSYNVPV